MRKIKIAVGLLCAGIAAGVLVHAVLKTPEIDKRLANVERKANARVWRLFACGVAAGVLIPVLYIIYTR